MHTDLDRLFAAMMLGGFAGCLILCYLHIAHRIRLRAHWQTRTIFWIAAPMLFIGEIGFMIAS